MMPSILVSPDRFQVPTLGLQPIAIALCAMVTLVAPPLVAVTPTFVDVSDAAGIDALHDEVHAYFITGQAWGDVDGDGCVDLYLTTHVGANRSYRNRCDGTFEPAPWETSAALAEHTSGGAAFADYDNDGDLDLAVANRGPNVLLRNDDGTFTDVSSAAGLGHEGHGESVAWGDFDGDGHLDLFITNWFYYEDAVSPLNRDVLLRSRGDGTFENLSSMLDPDVSIRPGFAVGFADLDQDGAVDIYVVNDKTQGNALWRNNGPGCGGWCFTDIAPTVGAVRPISGMGLAVGDIDNDGDLDMAFSGVGEVALLINRLDEGTLQFEDMSLSSGVVVPPGTVAWATIFFDYDNDRLLDLYVATRYTEPARADRLYRNAGIVDGDVQFEDVSEASGLQDVWGSNGAACADFDNDGRPDLLIGNRDANFRLFRNVDADAAIRGHLHIEVEGRSPLTRDAVGTRVELVDSAGIRQTRVVTSGDSFGAGSAQTLYFGLGDATAVSLDILWPDGLRETRAVPTDQTRLAIVYPRVFANGFESGNTAAWSSSTMP